MPKLEAAKVRPNAQPGWEILLLLLLLLIANPRFRRALQTLLRSLAKARNKGQFLGQTQRGGAVRWGTERQRAGRRVKSRQERDADAVKGGPIYVPRPMSRRVEGGMCH
jgi:hypothetical protein